MVTGGFPAQSPQIGEHRGRWPGRQGEGPNTFRLGPPLDPSPEINALHDAAKNRGCNPAAPLLGSRVEHHDEAKKLRLSSWQEPDERDDELVPGIPSAVPGSPLGGTGFSSNFDPGNPGEPSRAVPHYRREDLLHGRRRLLRDHAADHLRFHDRPSALPIVHLAKNLWSHQLTAVGNCPECLHHLQGGNRNFLPDGDSFERAVGPLPGMSEQSGALGWQTDPGPGAKSEVAQVLVEPGTLHVACDLHRPDVARIHQNVAGGQPTVLPNVPDHIPVVQPERTVLTVDLGFRIRQVLLENRSGCECLEGRTWLERIGYRPVAANLGREFPGFVGIEQGHTRHRQDLSGLRLGDDGVGPFGTGRIDGADQFLFQYVLKHGIDREGEA